MLYKKVGDKLLLCDAAEEVEIRSTRLHSNCNGIDILCFEEEEAEIRARWAAVEALKNSDETKLSILREKRNKLLQETDKYILPDFPISSVILEQYKTYRIYLRDCTNIRPILEVLKSFEEFCND